MNSLLIIGCSQRKVQSDEFLAAIDRYDGPAYRTLRKMRNAGTEPKNVDVFIISAKHGLILSQTPIDDYDLRMTPKRADTLRPRIQNLLRMIVDIKRGGYDQVFINLGKTYMQTLDGFYWGTIPTMEASGGIGQKTQQMKAWLERLRGPELMGHLSCSACNDTWFRDLDDMEIQAYIDAHPELEERILAREITDVDLGEVLCDGCEDYYEDLAAGRI